MTGGLSAILDNHRAGLPDCPALAKIALKSACQEWAAPGIAIAVRNLASFTGLEPDGETEQDYRRQLDTASDGDVLAHAAWIVRQR